MIYDQIIREYRNRMKRAALSIFALPINSLSLQLIALLNFTIKNLRLPRFVHPRECFKLNELGTIKGYQNRQSEIARYTNVK